MKQKLSKSWDMRYHWIRDKHTQKLINVYWQPGKKNEADYFTKHFPAKYHKQQREKYILKANLVVSTFFKKYNMHMQGCISEQISHSHSSCAQCTDQAFLTSDGLT